MKISKSHISTIELCNSLVQCFL